MLINIDNSFFLKLIGFDVIESVNNILKLPP